MNRNPLPQEMHWPKGTIFTVGHSTLPIDQFVHMLETYAIKQLVDIRTIPGSRHNPQFNAESLAKSLDDNSITYIAMPALGGRRHSTVNSPNGGWRNKSFRGYADYMQTSEFNSAVDALVELGEKKRSAIMCAESVPWRCHRSLVADALEVRGVPVIEILSPTSYRFHRLTSFASVHDGKITYPPEQPALL